MGCDAMCWIAAGILLQFLFLRWSFSFRVVSQEINQPLSIDQINFGGYTGEETKLGMDGRIYERGLTEEVIKYLGSVLYTSKVFDVRCFLQSSGRSTLGYLPTVLHLLPSHSTYAI